MWRCRWISCRAVCRRLADRLPRWSLGIFRTWLATGRTPRDLLLDFAATHWLVPETALDVRESRRADGAALAGVRHPGRNQTAVVARGSQRRPQRKP